MKEPEIWRAGIHDICDDGTQQADSTGRSVDCGVPSTIVEDDMAVTAQHQQHDSERMREDVERIFTDIMNQYSVST